MEASEGEETHKASAIPRNNDLLDARTFLLHASVDIEACLGLLRRYFSFKIPRIFILLSCRSLVSRWIIQLEDWVDLESFGKHADSA